VARRSALDNRRFRTVLLASAGIPIVLDYLWRTLVGPLLTGSMPLDFAENYLPAAAKIAAGRDPYDLCVIQGCAAGGAYTPLPLAGAQYVTPPPLAWMLQPLLGLPQWAQLAVLLVALQLGLAVFLVAALRALRVDDWQAAALLILVALAFEPVAGNFDEGQVNLLLLGLSGVWLLGWVRGDRWWAGAALGVGVAIKLLQAPLGLLLLWGRRWRMVVAGAVAGLGLLLLAVPQYLPEYVLKVAPVLEGGTGLFENHSPGGTVIRLFAPATFLGAARDVPVAARVVTAVIALASLAVTFAVLRRPRTGLWGRALEAGSIVAVTPLIASYSWGTHLVLLLLPMFVLVAWSVPRRQWTILALVGLSWFLIGPVHKLLQVLLVTGYADVLILRVLAEAGVVGILALWIASLLAVRRFADD
jgi:arabinofuranan 3-O-arabinosyltransferase